MIASGFWFKPEATLADWLHACDEINQPGRPHPTSGIATRIHNHHFEFKQLDGASSTMPSSAGSIQT